jgi:hypothetical protein
VRSLLYDPIPHGGDVEVSVKMPVEVVIRNKLLEGNGNGSVERATLGGTERRQLR